MQRAHPAVLIWLHWIMLLMIAVVYFAMECRDIFDKGTVARSVMLTTHYVLGLLILVLAIFRLIIWLLTSKASLRQYGKFQQVSAKIMFLALYALMIVMPLLGWADLNAYGVKIKFLSSLLPVLLQPNETLALQLSDIHITFGKIGYVLIALHTAAALFHHFVQRDDTLKRMLRFRQ